MTTRCVVVVAWADGWYGFNLDGVEAVAERMAFIGRLCDERGRDRSELRVTVALRELHLRDVPELAQLGVDELVLVDGPPRDPALGADWVSGLAERWMPALG